MRYNLFMGVNKMRVVSVRVSVTVRVSLVWLHRHFLFKKISKWHGFSWDSAKWGIIFYRAILSRNFIAWQNRKCDMARRATSQQTHNSFSDYSSALFCATLSRKCGERWLVSSCLCNKATACDTACHTCDKVARQNRKKKLHVWH